MSECTNEIHFCIFSMIRAIERYYVVMIDEPLEKYDRFWIIKWAFFLIILHMSLVEWFIDNGMEFIWI
jgi:hypothetical protein